MLESKCARYNKALGDQRPLLTPGPARLTRGFIFALSQELVIGFEPLANCTFLPFRMIETSGVTPLPILEGKGTLKIAGSLGSASNSQYLLLPTDTEMVAFSLTSAHAKTASSGRS